MTRCKLLETAEIKSKLKMIDILFSLIINCIIPMHIALKACNKLIYYDNVKLRVTSQINCKFFLVATIFIL